MSVTPKASWPWVKTLLHSVYDQPDAASVHAQFGRVLDALAEMRRYIGLDILAKSRDAGTTANATEEVTLTAITA
jgi:transposase-like protein